MPTRLLLLLICSVCPIAVTAAEGQLSANDVDAVRRLELPLEHALYPETDQGNQWRPGTLVITVTATEMTAPTAVVIIDRAGPAETLRLEVDTSALTWESPKLAGTVTYTGYRDDGVHTLELTCTASGTSLRGTYHMDHKRHRRGGIKDAAHGKGRIDGLCLDREDLAERRPVTDGCAWPGWRGGWQAGVADGNGKQELVTDLREARFLWQSDQGTPMPGHTDSRLLGGYGELCVAQNRVYLNYYVGSGDHYPEGKDFAGMVAATRDHMEHKHGRGIREYVTGYFGGDVEAYVRQKRPVLAADVIDCYDLHSGATLWRATFPDHGLNWYNCDGPHFNPTWSDGRVFAVGSAGYLYALDATTGETLWKRSLPGVDVEKRLSNALQEAAAGGYPNKHGNSRDLVNKPYVHGGVLAVAERGLYGLDVATGKTIWGPVTEVDNGNPRPWTHGGTDYFLCRLQYGRGGYGDGIVCVEARSGRVLWVDRRFAGQHGKEFANDDQFLFAGGGGIDDDDRRDDDPTVYEPTCYRLSPKGLERLWSLPPITKQPRMAAPVILDGYVYTYWHGSWNPGDPQQTFLVGAEAATGEIVLKHPMSKPGSSRGKLWQSLTAGNHRLIHAQGQQGPAPMLFRTGPDAALLHDGSDKQAWWSIRGTFQVLSPILVDGLYLLREKGDSGVLGSRIYCFDLRAETR